MATFRLKDLALLIACVLVCEGVGFVSARFTIAQIPTWYASLRKPPFNPPNGVFGPVWTTLYLLMGIAIFLVLRQGFTRSGITLAVALFAVQLILNFAWTYVFFGRESIAGGLVVILALWLAIVATIAAFFPVSRVAAFLLVPYLAWVSFASVLNLAILRLNG